MAEHKILVIDDSLTIQKVIRLALSNEGYDIQAISSGDEAIEQLTILKPDIVLIDVSIPGKTSYSIRKEAKENEDLKSIKFVLMSSAFEQVDEEQVESVGFDGRLVKPFDPIHLRQVLVDALAANDDSTPPSLPIEDKSHSELTLQNDEETFPKFDINPPTAPSITDDELWNTPSNLNIESEQSDIKQLTESTIKMSKLDELDWSVNEPNKKSFPTLPPFENFESIQEQGNISSLHSSGGSQPKSSTHYEAVPLSSKDLEEAVKIQLSDKLEEMTKKILPELAEKIIKEEIHKLLKEQF